MKKKSAYVSLKDLEPKWYQRRRKKYAYKIRYGGKGANMKYKVSHMMDDMFKAMPREDRVKYLYRMALIDYTKSSEWKEGVMEGTAFSDVCLRASYREFIRNAYSVGEDEPPIVYEIAELTLESYPPDVRILDNSDKAKLKLSSMYGTIPKKGE